MTSSPKKTSKQLKNNKKNENKAWLAGVTSHHNLESSLYPALADEDRNPHTREIMLSAQQMHGLNQSEIGKLCEVSQSMVSQWSAGESRATVSQLKPLVDRLTPFAPGSDFHIEEVVMSVSLNLGENWEEECVLSHLRDQHGSYDINTANDIQQYALRGVHAEEKDALEKIHLEAESRIKVLEDQERELRGCHNDFEQEREDNQSALSSWEKRKTEYLESNSELHDLGSEKIDSMMRRNVPKPELESKDALKLESKLRDILNDSSLEVGAETSNYIDENYSKAIADIKNKISLIEDELERLIESENDFWTKEKNERVVFGRWNKDVDTNSIELGVDLSKYGERIKEVAAGLYGGRKLTLEVPKRFGFGYRSDLHGSDEKIVLDMEKVVVEYIEEKIGNFDVDIDVESVQLCGENIYDEENLSIYSLTTGRIALISDWTCKGKKYFKSDEKYKTFHMSNNANDALAQLRELGYSDVEISKVARILAESGYKTPGYRIVY